MSEGYLTTHILDTANGVPAAGVRVVLYRLNADTRTKITEAVTNSDGRTSSPILPQADFQVGEYELEFYMGDYFVQTGQALPSPKFLAVIPIRFGMSDSTAHYHVPLLASPYGYSTYRGS